MKTKLQAEENYSKRLQEYTVRDSAWAIGYYVLMVVVYYFMGRAYANTGKYYGYYVNICLMIIPLIIVRKFSALGLCRKNLKRSLIVSATIGLLILLIFTIIPGILTGSTLLHLAFTALYRWYGNIWGSTVLHGLLDLSMSIFV